MKPDDHAEGGETVKHHDLDWMFGALTEEEAAELDAAIRDQRRIED